jgi:hypothetical protein
MGAVILVVVFLVGMGLLSLLAPDLMWSWTQWNNELKGLQSERTDTWEMGRTFSGLIMIGVGLFFGLWGCGEASSRENASIERTALFEDRAATQRAEAIVLDGAFSGAVDQLLELATEEMQTVRAYKLGVETETYTTIDYGRCDDSGDFYMYIFNYQGDWQTYAYGIGDELCKHPDRLYMSANELGGGERGGVWYTLAGFRKPMPTDEAVTPIAATPTPEATED